MPRKRKEKLSYEQIVEAFVKVCGLRKAELERLRVRDFYRGHHDFTCGCEQWIHVDAFEDIPAHEVPFLCDEWLIPEICKGRGQDDLVFLALPALDYEGLRETYADDIFLIYFYSLGRTGAPRTISELGKLLKQALGLRHYDEKRRREMRWASRNIKRLFGTFSRN